MSVTDLLHEPAARAIGWALLHFVWQGALIGAVTALVLACLRRSAADVRYVVATIALALMTTMPIVTGVQAWHADRDGAVAASRLDAPSVTPLADDSPALPVTSAAAPSQPSALNGIDLEPWLPALVACWFAGVLVLTLRLASGWLWVQRMKFHGTAPVSASLDAIVARLARRLHITRCVRLSQSTLVDVPTVIGWIKPAILLPASALAGLTPVQVEAILAHELAHIRRHDYLVNLLQTLVETLLFYHPAVWWISRRIRVERENCCDDLAVSLCGDPVTYAKALADLEDLRGAGGELVMAATGGSLLHRVRRLLGAPSHAGRAPGWLAGAAAVLVVFGIVAGVVGTSAMDAQATSPTPAAEPALPVMQPIATPEIALAPRSREEARAVAAVDAARQQAPTPPAPAKETGKSTGSMIWSTNGEKVEIKYSGSFEFSDDDTDIARMSPNSELRIRDGGWIGSRTVEFRSDAGGNISRRYWNGMSEKPFDPEGRQWLAQMLPRFIRQSGIGAPARVARILKKDGAQGVLREISAIEGSYGKRIYFTELLKNPLDAATAKQVLTQAGKEIDSDYELATLLIAAADKLLVDDATRRAYFEATQSISSDYEARRVYSAALKRGPMSPALLAAVLDASRSIDSDYEEASLLIQVAGLQPIDGQTAAPFFRAVDSLGSDYERGRVLKEILKRPELSDESVLNVIRAVRSMGSDYERSQVLQQLAGSRQITGQARDAYIDVASSFGDYEQGRALAALLKSERRAK